MENRSKAIKELMRGREFANQLREVINRSNGEDDKEDESTCFAEQLAGKVVASFTNTLSLLNRKTESDEEAVSQLQLRDSSRWINPSKSEDSEGSSKSCTAKDRRGCYKRRRTSQTWEKESESPKEDGHGWRKYGQKMILNAKYPRNYYRCTHKFDQDCQATKQVQRIQEEPPLFRTTYYGNHTCRNLLNPEIILGAESPSGSSVFLSFDNTLQSKQDLPFLTSSFPSVKKEFKEEIGDVQMPENQSSTSDNYLASSELTFDSSNLEPDHKDVYDSLDIDVLELIESAF